MMLAEGSGDEAVIQALLRNFAECDIEKHLAIMGGLGVVGSVCRSLLVESFTPKRRRDSVWCDYCVRDAWGFTGISAIV